MNNIDFQKGVKETAEASQGDNKEAIRKAQEAVDRVATQMAEVEQKIEAQKRAKEETDRAKAANDRAKAENDKTAAKMRRAENELVKAELELDSAVSELKRVGNFFILKMNSKKRSTSTSVTLWMQSARTNLPLWSKEIKQVKEAIKE